MYDFVLVSNKEKKFIFLPLTNLVLIDNAYYQAKKLVSEHMDKLELVANRLMEKEIISAEEFESFFEEE